MVLAAGRRGSAETLPPTPTPEADFQIFPYHSSFPQLGKNYPTRNLRLHGGSEYRHHEGIPFSGNFRREAAMKELYISPLCPSIIESSPFFIPSLEPGLLKQLGNMRWKCAWDSSIMLLLSVAMGSQLGRA